MKKNHFWQFIWCTLIPIVVPFIPEIPDDYIANPIKYGLMIILLVIDILFIWKFYKLTNKDARDERLNKIICSAHSKAYELSEQKRDFIIKYSYENFSAIPRNKIPYDVHDYISQICKNFRDVISEITCIGQEYMSVTFIYHYIFKRPYSATDSEKSWRWVVGKEAVNQTELDAFIDREDSLYHYIIYGDGKKRTNSVFYNDKKELAQDAHYYMSPRDKDHNKIGSVFAVKIVFGNNAQSFVEAILLISTYGKRFIEEGNEDYTENELKNLIFEDLFPYYQRLLETELGMLYLKHEKNQET